MQPLRWLYMVGHYLYYPDKLLAPLIDVFAANPIRWGTRILLLSLFIGGGLFSVVEKDATYADGIWWAYISALTVGYGDFSPATVVMRICTVGIVFGGALFLIGLGSAVNSRATVKRWTNTYEQITSSPEVHDDLDVIGNRLRELLQEALESVEMIEQIEAKLRARETGQEGVLK
jgi:voltage-gated potassium channel